VGKAKGSSTARSAQKKDSAKRESKPDSCQERLRNPPSWKLAAEKRWLPCKPGETQKNGEAGRATKKKFAGLPVEEVMARGTDRCPKKNSL